MKLRCFSSTSVRKGVVVAPVGLLCSSQFVRARARGETAAAIFLLLISPEQVISPLGEAEGAAQGSAFVLLRVLLLTGSDTSWSWELGIVGMLI